MNGMMDVQSLLNGIDALLLQMNTKTHLKEIEQ